MFRAHRAHHQERQIVSIQPLVTVTLCRVQVPLSWNYAKRRTGLKQGCPPARKPVSNLFPGLTSLFFIYFELARISPRQRTVNDVSSDQVTTTRNCQLSVSDMQVTNTATWCWLVRLLIERNSCQRRRKLTHIKAPTAVPSVYTHIWVLTQVRRTQSKNCTFPLSSSLSLSSSSLSSRLITGSVPR